MATPAGNDRKLASLYAGLTAEERVRLLTRLSREEKGDEIARLRYSTPSEHADAYNGALGLLRVLNVEAVDWVMQWLLLMERDRLLTSGIVTSAAHRWLSHARLHTFWRVTPFPATEAEYRAVVAEQRAAPEAIDEYASFLLWSGTRRPGLQPDLAAILAARPEEPSDEDDEACWRRVLAAIAGAVKRGELPKPKLKDGERWLPAGVLSDWALGTTAETYVPYGPGLSVPALSLFSGDAATWEVRPDAEAEAVRARRADLLAAVAEMAGVPDRRTGLPITFDPPATPADRRAAEKVVAGLHDAWWGGEEEAEALVGVARRHAETRADVAAMSQAVNALQDIEFCGEDPLRSHARAILDAAEAEAARYAGTWEGAASLFRFQVRHLLRLPQDGWREWPPAPEAEVDAEAMARTIRSWADIR